MRIIGLLTRDKKTPVSVYTAGSVPDHATEDRQTTVCGHQSNETHWTFTEKPHEQAVNFVSCSRCAKKLDLNTEEK